MPRPPPRLPYRQRGVALLLILLVAVTVGLGLLFTSSSSGGRFLRQDATQQSLGTAKAALMGYAASYREQVNPDRVLGYLPCADTNNSGTQNIAGCSDFFTPPEKNRMGRFPFGTLGLDTLRDSSTECLWYAVSREYKTTNDTDLMNWDLRGSIRIEDPNGAAMADPGDSAGGAVSVVFAPGPAIPAAATLQPRSGGNRACAGDTTNAVSDWLDAPGYGGTVPGTLTVRQGIPGSESNNDQVAWITPKELWDPIAKRSDLLGDGNQMLTELVGCLNSQSALPLPSAANLDDLAGADTLKWRVGKAGLEEILASPLTPACAWSSLYVADLWSNWSDHLRYVVCKTGTKCLSFNGTPNQCTGVLLFGGRKSNGLPRSNAEKLDPTSYFETPNIESLAGGGAPDVNFSGAPAYDPANQSKDLAYCLNPPPPPGPLTFADGISPVFNTDDLDGDGNPDIPPLVSYDSLASALTLGADNVKVGDAALSALGSCAWIGTPRAIGNGFRAYFRFLILERGPGFTFAVADGTRNPTADRCGSGDQHLGYSGAGIFNGIAKPIEFPKLAVEFDFDRFFGDSRNDPLNDHISIVFWGTPGDWYDDNEHAKASSTAGMPDNPPKTPPATLEDGNLDDQLVLRSARIELHLNSYDGTTGSYTVKVWVNLPSPPFADPPNFADTSVDFPNPPPIQHTFSVGNVPDGTRAFETFRIGFTSAAGANDQRIQITNFEARSR